MKAAKTWRLAGVLVLVGMATASCGKDEATGGQGGSGSVLGGSGGSAGTGGGRPDGGTNNATALGMGCINDGECADAKAPNLICVTATETVLGDGAPPKGMCTAECVDDADCQDFGAGALCYPFTETTGYCVEGCSFGDPGEGVQKCHDRPEFACNPALLGRTQTTCEDASDCGDGEICSSQGLCNVVFPACLPSCRGDIDCADGLYCDQSFLSGVCVEKKPTGKALGEPCTVPGADEPSEPDECLGFCQADDATGTTGHCSASCGLGYECAYDSGTEKFDGACVSPAALSGSTAFIGDFGFCTPTCDCTSQCNDPALVCQLLQQGELPTELFKGAGICDFEARDGSSVEYNECTGVGGGGAGGAGPGVGGETSVGGGGGGGEPSSEGGVPTVGGGGAGG